MTEDTYEPTRQSRRGQGKATILVADDDQGILTIVSRLLQSDGFTVLTCSDGRRALELFRSLEPQLVILDVNMPEMDGLSVCREIRSESDVPIIILTVAIDEMDATKALEMGADDYVRKPFGVEELAARVRAVLRRSQLHFPGADHLHSGSLTVDEREHAVFVGEEALVLSPTEFKLLDYLLRNPNRFLTHDQVLEAIWGIEYMGSSHVLRVAMSRLRQRLGAEARRIQTIPGLGYRFDATQDE